MKQYGVDPPGASPTWILKNGTRRSVAGYDPGVNAEHAILLRVNVQHARGQLLWGGLLLAFFFLLRKSEYLLIGRKHHRYALRLGDIVFRNEAGQHVSPRQAEVVGIRLSGAKNNQFGREDLRFHSRSGDKVLCPVKAARWILREARAFATPPDQPALSTGFGSGITAEEVADTLKQAASALGLEARLYSTHSVLIGGATELMNSGADRLVIKLMVRWLSNAFEGYPILSAKGSRGLARLMCKSTSS
ncbi:hypothetical protein PPTG_09856 [Phytophthora nicotianae INRA-310]|uniref:Tyr recombinase domain-containing protein n=1 Tax=Phytophthora nicotianae (strain INRA-310) TaxID=761204 RepID=W2QEU5_PHYN3|nr:hypothetical protein PPTG_09856 [Phytophthora nicotianae INRA-310]ETN10775.1 hypothetical protein PPTG_09856 [Phytophthora nicotianae INRA-310]